MKHGWLDTEIKSARDDVAAWPDGLARRNEIGWMEKAREIVPPHCAFWNGKPRDYQAEVAQALKDATAAEQERCINIIHHCAINGDWDYDFIITEIRESGYG